jgi:hypothetical protein
MALEGDQIVGFDNTLYHIVAWRMALVRRHLGAAEKRKPALCFAIPS